MLVAKVKGDNLRIYLESPISISDQGTHTVTDLFCCIYYKICDSNYCLIKIGLNCVNITSYTCIYHN